MKIFVIAAVAGAALLTSACADDYYGPRHLRGDRAYSVYYDNYYGPVRDGRWGDDGYYYYRGQGRDDYVRDDAHHFRRDAYDGYRGMSYDGAGAGVSVGVGGSVGVGIGVRP